MNTNAMTSTQFAALFDHSLLQPYNTLSDFSRHLEECAQYRFYSAAVNSCQVPLYAEKLKGTGVLVGAAVSFPFGQASPRAKESEARIALEEGAAEIDYVLNIGKLLDGDTAFIREEMRRLVDVCHSREAVCKVILETCYLTEPAKKLACEVALDTGIDYVKTSTGFGTAGATAQDVRLFRSIVGGHVKIKAAGAMRTLDDVTAVLEAGVDRIGSAFSVSILKEFQARHTGL
ncbi:deoxyribose-phosphate aldolase [Candidatus Allofournierella excrementavium]|uniref:deoxyribose-phosphate aldolase n=1 Tax=Candidatus Allofournierella excrementavium TaxID=2838591 RepID=UPI003AB49A8D